MAKIDIAYNVKKKVRIERKSILGISLLVLLVSFLAISLQVSRPWGLYNYDVGVNGENRDGKELNNRVEGIENTGDVENVGTKEAGESIDDATVDTALDTITLIFGGDVMLARNVGYNIKYSGFDPFSSTKALLTSADLAMVNLECVISDKGYKNSYKAYTFRAPVETLTTLKSAGIDIVSLANNHVADYGNSAFSDMLERLKASGVGYVGGGLNEEEAYSPLYVEIKGVRFAFLAFSNIEIPWFTAQGDSMGVAWFDDSKVVSAITTASQNSDYVVVMPHWGIEYTDVLLPDQERLAHLMIDSGADLIIGGHPHHTQRIEEYNGGKIYYSVGNFIFDGPGTHAGWYDGYIVEVRFTADTDENGVPVLSSPVFTEHHYKLDNAGLATLQ